jgi:transcriptional regulator with XRE-family HTH domain
MIETPFGNLLSKYRDRKDLKLEELAEKAQVSPSYISLLIRGKKGRPTNQVIERLAQALDLTEAEKLEFRGAAEVSKVDGSPKKLESQLPYKLPQLPDEAGIEVIHPDLSADLLEKHFLSATKLIRIQDNWLQDLPTYNRLFRQMLEGERPELEVQILLLDPTSDFAKLREKALNLPKGYLSRQIESATDIFKDIYKDFEKKFGSKFMEMKRFNVVPSVQHIAFDETIFIGFNSHTKRSQDAYQLQIRGKSDLGSFFKADFQKVWKMPENKQIIPEP